MDDRLSAPTATGMRFPVLLGEGGTAILMYLALNRGATARQIRDVVGLKNGAFHKRMERLRRMRLVVGEWWYQIPTDLRNEKQLVLFLRALGVAYGMSGNRGTYGERNKVARDDRVIKPTPEAIFGNVNRTRILIAVAALNESYALELHQALRIHLPSVRRALEDMRIEGVLTRREVGRAACYALNPEYPGAEDLLTYLRLECKAEPTMVAGVNAALARRVEVERAGRRSDVHKFAELKNTAIETMNAPKGTERKVQPRRRWKRLNGSWNGERFAQSREGRRFRLTADEHEVFRNLVLGDGKDRGRLHAWARALERHLEKHDRIKTPDHYHWLYYRLVVSPQPMLRSDASKIAIAGLRAVDPVLPPPHEWGRTVLEHVPRVAAHRAKEFVKIANEKTPLV
jgi:DNA-binding transcriptional ArsR family regulator